MSKLLLLVQSEADVAHLSGAATAILSSALTGVWVVFSPAITVNASEAASKLDAEIDGLKKAEREAAERSDYEAAAGYKLQREGKELDRAKALRDAWKTAPAEDRQARTNAIFGPFVEKLKAGGRNARVTMHGDHYDREQWVALLNSLSGVWFKEFTPGGFVVAWPESVAGAIKTGGSERWAEVTKAAEAVVPSVPRMPSPEDREKYRVQSQAAGKPQTREQELTDLHPMKLGPVMRGLGLNPDGLTRVEKIAAILAAEAKPALAEY